MDNTDKNITLKRSLVDEVLTCLERQRFIPDMDAENRAENEHYVDVLLEKAKFYLTFEEEVHKLKKSLIEKASEKWNSDFDRLLVSMNLQREDNWDERHPNTPIDFSWTQLVWQEIFMWIAISVDNCLIVNNAEIWPGPITQEDFDSVCYRRGFEDPQRNYLLEMLGCLGLDIVDELPSPSGEAVCADADQSSKMSEEDVCET